MSKKVGLKYYAPDKTYPEKKYATLKNAVVDVIKKLSPELNKKFDVDKIVKSKSSKGLLRDKLGRDNFGDNDRYAFLNILQELIRKDKIIVHVSGSKYARIK